MGQMGRVQANVYKNVLEVRAESIVREGMARWCARSASLFQVVFKVWRWAVVVEAESLWQSQGVAG
jgi:hypothetical protein